MKKILIFSDSHGDLRFLQEAIGKKNPDMVFFTGDGQRDIAAVCRLFPALDVFAVRGNNDDALYPDSLSVTVEGIRFFLTHGHRYGVNRGLLRLLAQTKQEGCDVAVFGHTHHAVIVRDETGRIIALNSGSCRHGLLGGGSYIEGKADNGKLTAVILYRKDENL